MARRAQQHRAEQVHFELGAQIVDLGVGKQIQDRHARVVHEQLDRPERSLGGGVERVDRVGLRDVEQVGEGAAARGFDLRRHLAQSLDAPGADRDGVALPRELERGRRADARTRRRSRSPCAAPRSCRRTAIRQRGEAAHVDGVDAHDARRLDLPAREPPLAPPRARRAPRAARATRRGRSACRGRRPGICWVSRRTSKRSGSGKTRSSRFAEPTSSTTLSPARKLLAVQLDVARHRARQRLGRVVVAQGLLDPERDQRRIAPHLLALVRDSAHSQ